MASQTPNLGLVLPVGPEHVSRQIVNENNTKIDTAVGDLNSNLSGKYLQYYDDAYNHLEVFRVGGIYIVNFTRKQEVPNGTECYTMNPDYAPNSSLASFGFYQQQSGYSLVTANLSTNGKIVLQASTYNEPLAGTFTWMYLK